MNSKFGPVRVQFRERQPWETRILCKKGLSLWNKWVLSLKRNS